MGTNGQPQGPQPHVHILPCPYYTQALRAYSSYSRGTLSGGQVKRGEDVESSLGERYRWALVVARLVFSSPYLKCIAHKGCHYISPIH